MPFKHLQKKHKEPNFSLEERIEICSKKILIEWANLNLNQRCQKIMELFSKHIGATTLLSYYKKFGVSYTRVVYSHPIRYSPEDYKLKR